MLRRLLLYLSTAKWARGLVTHWGVARRVAKRFIAGETIDEVMSVTRSLNEQGMLASIDYLGESVTHASDTEAVVTTYRSLIEQIEMRGLKAGISLKLTHMGLDISEELCLGNLRRVLTDAKNSGVPVTIDMESSHYTDTTLRIYRTLRDEYDFTNVGTVIQAYLYRSKADMQTLATEGATIRLCKGAYLEPGAIAFPEKKDVDAQYAQIMTDYLLAAPPAFLQMATHDETLIQQAERVIKDHQLRSNYEFQMLYGIRAARQRELAAAGHPMRVYVPFGEAWYPYFMRRLAERPANLWFFARSFFRA